MQFPDPVGSSEPIARYLMEKSKFRVESKRVMFNAFMPAHDNAMSAYRIGNLAHEEIVKIGKQFVADPQQKSVLAYAAVNASDISDQGLTIEPTAEPHPRHVNVTGWTESIANRSRAQIIAALSTLVLK